MNPIRGKQGRFELVPKRLINIDYDYQRTRISPARVARIANDFDWAKFGVVMLARRPDGSSWAFDGQTRKLGADRRDDVNLLPCLVFDCTSREEEAAYFKAVNCDRGSIKAIERFKADLCGKDPLAIAVRDTVAEFGYTVQTGGARQTVSCVQELMYEVDSDASLARSVFKLCADIQCGDSFTNKFLGSLFALEREMRKRGTSILDSPFRESLLAAGPAKIERQIAEGHSYHNKPAGHKAGADGIRKMLNKGRRTNLLPAFMEDGADD